MEEDFRTLLLEGGGSPAPVAALVGDRVTWQRRPQGAALPLLVCHVISKPHEYVMEGPANLAMGRVQVDCWGETYVLAKQLARAVVQAVSGFRGTVGGTDFQGVFVDNETDRDDRDGGERAERDHCTQLDLLVWHAL